METGFQYPTTVVFNGKVTGNEWSNPNNIFLTDTDVTESNPGAGVASDFTIGGYNFSIPMDAVVDGIEIQLIGFQGMQTVPQLALTVNAYDNTGGADAYYPYTAPFTDFGTDLASFTIGGSTYLFSTTWTVDQINNFKLNLVANGDISLDCVLVNVHYHLTTPPTPPTPTPGMCIDCSSPIQVQEMELALPFLAGDTTFYLKAGSFVYPNGVPVQPGDIGSCGGVIDLVFDEGMSTVNGGNFEENVQINLTAGASWTVLSSGVIEVDIVSVNYRGLDYKTPAAHVASNMSDHNANSKVIISNNEPYNLQLVRRCQAGTVFSAPIAVWQDGNSGTPVSPYLQVLNVLSPLSAVLDGTGQVDLSLNVVSLANNTTFLNALTDNSTFIEDLTTNPLFQTNVTEFITTGGGVLFETNGDPNGSQALLNLIAGSNMSITESDGAVTFASTGGGGGSGSGGLFANSANTSISNNFSGTQTIPHGMAAAPTKVRLSVGTVSNSNTALSLGAYNSLLSQNTCLTYQDFGSPFVDGSHAVNLQNNSSAMTATVTVDATNIYLHWAQSGTVSGGSTVEIFWEAETGANSGPALLGTATLGAAASSISVTIPSGFKYLTFEVEGRTLKIPTNYHMSFNGDSTSDYGWMIQTNGSGSFSNGTTDIQMSGISGSGTATYDMYITGSILNPTTGNHLVEGATSSSSVIGSSFTGYWNHAAQITTITVSVDDGDQLQAGAIINVYGHN